MPRTEAEFQDLSRELRNQAKRYRTVIRNTILVFALINSPMLIYFCKLGDSNSEKWGILMVILFICSIPILLWFVLRPKQFAVERLTRWHDVRAVGALVDIISLSDAKSCALARDALLELLPRMRASDAHLLNTQHRENLRVVLLGQDIALIQAMLNAYQQIGDERDIPAVEGLLSGREATTRSRKDRSKSKVADNPDVRDAALECLAFLQAKAQQSRISQTLLRAADQPGTVSAELLRPVASTVSTDPQQLLRSSQE